MYDLKKMTNMKALNFKKWSVFSLVLLGTAFTSCLSDGDETIVLEEGGMYNGIPNDSKARPNPEVTNTNAYIPNFNYTVEGDGKNVVIRLDMNGVQDPNTKEWLDLIGTGYSQQNIWVSVDGKPKGILVTKNSENENNRSKAVDLVFLVDNSGSMSEEADAIARDIVSWAQKLKTSGLDVRFGCVGYGGNVGANGYNYLVSNYGITGALDFTSYNLLNKYLNERGLTGTNRTKGYYGDNATSLQAKAVSLYSKAGGECGVQALRFADENFAFQSGANRIYVNFTDDYNFPGGTETWSIRYIENTDNWKTNQGTIHSVISRDTTSWSEISLVREKPWRLSQYTGGTILQVPSNFAGASLESLPVTGAMLNSYEIRFTNVAELMDGQPHEVLITILSADGKVRAEKRFYIIFGTR